jgi:nucleoside-diphosphate-sugar epimerase
MVSWVEIKPASKGRNDPASGARIRPPEREAFFFRTSLISTSYAGLFGRKMPTYADFRGWVISTIAGWFPVTADKIPCKIKKFRSVHKFEATPLFILLLSSLLRSAQTIRRHLMKVTVTGAAGKLGIYVCQALVNAGYSVRATDKARMRRTPVQLEISDLLDREACYRLVTAADAVVHLANYSDNLMSDAQKLFNENVAMNMNVFQAALDSGVRHVIFSSSIQVIGNHSSRWTDRGRCVPYLPLDGDTPANPGNAYALSKQVGEVMLSYFSRQAQMTCVALRFPWLVDPAKRKLSSRMPTRATKLEQVFSYLSFSDAASLIAAILRSQLPGFRIYLPAYPHNRLGQSAANLIRKYYQSVPLRCPLQKINTLIDIAQIKRETGWSPA